MLNLTLLERKYILQLIKNDISSSKPIANQMGLYTVKSLIEYIEGKNLENNENLCPDCNVYCEKRFIDGICE